MDSQVKPGSSIASKTLPEKFAEMLERFLSLLRIAIAAFPDC